MYSTKSNKIGTASNVDMKKALKVIKDSRELSSLNKSCNELYRFLEADQICSNEDMERFKARLQEPTGSTRLVDSMDIIRSYRENFIDELSEYQVKVFQHIQEGIDTINFIKELGAEFDKKTELATNLHSEQFESALITSFVNVRSSVSFILEFKKGSSVKEFCARAAERIPKRKSDIDRIVGYINSATTNLSRLRSWYSTSSLSIENLKPFTEEILRYGRFVGDMTKSGAGLYLEVEKDENKSTYSHGFIKNMIGGLNVFLAKKTSKKARDDDDDDNNEKEEEESDTQIVKGFVAIVDMAGEYYRTCLTLREFGHPQFQGEEVEVTKSVMLRPTKQGKENDAEVLEIIERVAGSLSEKINKVRGTLDEWKEIIGRMSSGENGEKRLLFLTPRELLMFWIVLSEAKNAGIMTKVRGFERYVNHYVMPYLFYCFPDAVDKLLANAWTVKNELEKAKGSFDNNVSPNEMMERITKYVQCVKAKIKVNDDDDNNDEEEKEAKDKIVVHVVRPKRPDEAPAGDPEGMPAVGQAPRRSLNAVYERVMRIFEGRVHPSLIFKCSRDTTGERLEWFLKRVDSFPNLTFVIIDVNELDIKAKETLLNWTTERLKGGIVPGELHLIFTDDTGYELFSFIENKADDDDYEGDLPQIENEAKWRPPIEVFKVYDGEPLSGKSYAIRHEIRKILEYHSDRQTTISVVEDFTAGTAGKKIEDVFFVDEGFYPNVALKLSVSPYAPMEAFGTFLYNLFSWGIITDESTGRIIQVWSELKWNVFVELGTPPEGDSECGYSSVDEIRSALPLLSTFSPVDVRTMDAPYEFSEDAKICATMECALYKKNTTDYWMLHINGNPATSFVREGHSDFNEFVSKLKPLGSYSIQGRIVKILSQRYQSILKYAENVKNNVVKPPRGRKFLTFKILTEKALDDELEQYKQYPLKNITKYLYFPVDAEPVLMDFSEGSRSLPAQEDAGEEGENKVSSLRFISLDDVLENPDMLYHVIGGAFNVNPEKCRTLLERREYVLTPDFGMKLMFLNTCCAANHNVVFSGDTGTGKSELLETFSQLVNIASKQLPHPVEELAEFFHKNLPGRAVESSKDALMQLVKDMCDSDDGRAFGEVRRLLAVFAKASKEKYKLLNPTEYMEAAIKALDEDSLAESLPSKDDVIQLARDIIRGDTKELFHKLQMHQHISPDMFRAKVNNVCTSAVTAGKDVTVIGFVDECTSTSVMGMVKEVLIDNTLDGDPLPCNIMWIGAFNRNDMNKAKEAKVIDYTGLSRELEEIEEMGGSIEEDEQEEEKDSDMNESEKQLQLQKKQMRLRLAALMAEEAPDFAVRPPPKSLEILEICFDPMSEKQQEYFLRNLLRLKAPGASDAEARDVEQATSFAHGFLREKRISRIHPSIRDFVRCVNLYVYFSEHSARMGGRGLDYFPSADEAGAPGAKANPRGYRHQYSLALAITIAYYFRLSPEFREEFVKGYMARKCVCPHLAPATREEDKSLLGEQAAAIAGKEDDPIFTAFKWAGLKLYKNTEYKEGIAATDSFLENLFCTVVCIDAKVPLMIFGPPGCSKTLSFTIAMKNMKGRHSKSDFYKGLSYVSPLRYQCSRESTDTEIQVVYENAERRQEGFDQAAKDGRNAGVEHQRVVVLLDEGGLPDETKAPLKILHYVLDHPKVSTVILTNKILDAAKTNRTALLQQTAPADNDLYQLVKTCVYSHSEGAIPDKKARVIRALAAGYRALMHAQRRSGNEVTGVRDFFHLRDFVYFLRYLGRCERKSEGSIEDITTVVHGLRRNFGGVDEKRFLRVARIFIDELQREIPLYDRSGLYKAVEDFGVTQALQESLAETIEDPSDPNTAPYRYVLVIDPSDTEVGTSLLFKGNVCDREKTDVVHVANFGNAFEDEDGDDSSNINGGMSAAEKERKERDKEDAIVQVKSAMEDDDGHTVMLVNPLEISSSFYDVFNRHFDVISEEDKVRKKTCYRYFANIAVGSLSQPCLVSPNFRLIVHLPQSALRRTPAPFLNRFEKYYLSLDKFFTEEMAAAKNTECLRLRDGINNAVDYFGGKNFFYGLVPKETVTSFLYNVCRNVGGAGSDGKVVIPPPFHAHKEEKKVWPGEDVIRSEDVLLENVRKANYHLFQLARPEWLLARSDVPMWYLEEYISFQEHFSVSRLVATIFDTVLGSPDDDNDSNADGSNENASGDDDDDDSDDDNDDDDGNAAAVAEEKECTGKCSKWCIFTRSCGELARLHKDTDVQNRLFRCSKKEGEFLSWGDVMSLESVQSSKECTDKIDEFIVSNKDVFVCVADMTKVTADQVNLVRSRIDSNLLKRRKVTLIIQHFPPEIQYIQDAQTNQVMYLNDWNYTYVDAIGLDSSSSYDARFWLKYAFGLQSEDKMEEMVKFFSNESKDAVAKLSRPLPKKPPQKADIPFSFDIYKAYKNKFPAFFKKDLLGSKKLTEKYFRKVLNTWCSLVQEIIRRDCTLIQRGVMSMGLLSHIDGSFKKIILPTVKRISEVLSTNLSLEAVMYALKNKAENEIDFISTIIDKLPIFTIDDFYATAIAKNYSESKIALEATYTTPSYLPLFDFVFKRVKELLKRAKSTARVPSEFQSVASTLSNLIAKDPLAEILEIVRGDKGLLELYLRDVVVWGIGLSHFYVPRKDSKPEDFVLLDKIVDRVKDLTNGYGNDLAYIHVVPEFYQKELLAYATVLKPLLQLRPLPKLPHGSLDPKETTVDTLLDVVTILREFLLDNHTGDDLIKFGKVFRDIKAFVPYKRKVRYDIDDSAALALLDREYILYLFLLNAKSEVDAYANQVAVCFNRNDAQDDSIQSGFNFAREICDFTLNEAGLDKKSFFGSVALYYLEYPSGSGEIPPKYVENDLETFLIVNNKPQSFYYLFILHFCCYNCPLESR